jgi:PAS domain S-box-containing protein
MSLKQNSLRPSEELYRMIFERASEGILVLDSNYEITHSNPMIGKMLECTEEELRGTNLSEFIHSDDLLSFREQQASRRRGETGFYECRYVTRKTKGTRYMIVSASPVLNDAGQYMGSFGFLTDITPRKLLQFEKEALQAKSQNAARMASLGEMAGGISHEINNPLAVISGIADQEIHLLESQDIPREELTAKFEKIRTMCDRIARIINGLHSIARDGEGDPFSFVSVHDLLDEVLDFCGLRFRHNNVDLRIPSEPISSLIECRRVQISQVLLNLLNNAFDAVAGKQGAWVSIDCLSIHRDGRDWVEVSIADSGTGIPPEVAARIMDPFFTTKGVGKGTGLGLSISDGIAKSHQGRLYLDTQAKNTRFVLELPVRQLQGG